MKGKFVMRTIKKDPDEFGRLISEFLERRKRLPEIRRKAVFISIYDPDIQIILKSIAKPLKESPLDCCVEGPESECKCIISED